MKYRRVGKDQFTGSNHVCYPTTMTDTTATRCKRTRPRSRQLDCSNRPFVSNPSVNSPARPAGFTGSACEFTRFFRTHAVERAHPRLLE
eukprot:3045976-Pyramimonas_sp.AAC.1